MQTPEQTPEYNPLSSLKETPPIYMHDYSVRFPVRSRWSKHMYIIYTNNIIYYVRPSSCDDRGRTQLGLIIVDYIGPDFKNVMLRTSCLAQHQFGLLRTTYFNRINHWDHHHHHIIYGTLFIIRSMLAIPELLYMLSTHIWYIEKCK